MSSKVFSSDNFPAPLMPVMITSSCWSRGRAGGVECGFAAGLLLAAREVARFFEGMTVGLSCGQRLSKIVRAVSYPDEVLGSLLGFVRPPPRHPWSGVSRLFTDNRQLATCLPPPSSGCGSAQTAPTPAGSPPPAY